MKYLDMQTNTLASIGAHLLTRKTATAKLHWFTFLNHPAAEPTLKVKLADSRRITTLL
jgi:hypothetical protein